MGIPMFPVPHPHVNEHVEWPDELTLYFTGNCVCSLPLWAWAIMDTSTLYASDRGHTPTQIERTHIWAATVALGKGLAFLNERKWTGKLIIKGNFRDCGVFKGFRGLSDPLTRRCLELLAGIKWKAEVITPDENDFCRRLCHQAYQEYGQN